MYYTVMVVLLAGIKIFVETSILSSPRVKSVFP
jgi:hypothetical protein